MAVLLFPKRVRCSVCRSKLTEVNVLSGLFCSRRCGGFKGAEVLNVDAAPRACKRQVSGVWSFKKRWASPDVVPAKYRDDPASNVYECENCHRFHIGHARPDTSHDPLRDDLAAVVGDPVALGEMIRKYREGLGVDKRTLAKGLKIPAVRITELESGDKRVSVAVLFSVVNALRMKVSLSGRAPRSRP